MEIDDNLNYKGYNFTYNDDEDDEDGGDNEYFDKLVENDNILSNNIELFFQDVCQEVKVFLLSND